MNYYKIRNSDRKAFTRHKFIHNSNFHSSIIPETFFIFNIIQFIRYEQIFRFTTQRLNSKSQLVICSNPLRVSIDPE